MDLYRLFILDSILILFPMLIWLFFVMYNKNIGKKENNLFLDFALVTSFYLVIRLGQSHLYGIPLLLLNVPLAVSYIKKRNISIFVLSISLIAYYSYYFSNYWWFFIIEYILYYFIFNTIQNKKNNIQLFLGFCLVIKIISFILIIVSLGLYRFDNINNFINIIILIAFMIAVSYGIIILCDLGEDILKFHLTLKEIEQEKQIKSSLFKITHEIKNPIAVCKGYLDMFDTNDINHSKKYIPIIKEEIERTLILLQDFLCMTKIKINCEIVDINMILEDVFDNFKPILKDNNIKGIINVSDESIYINGDYNRLTQAFINIIKNSVEAVDTNKKSYIKISSKLLSNKIKIIFEDNGVGISDENLQKISEPFFTTKKNGTGLGVSLAKEVINCHNGTITYKSKLGEGTKVEIILPLKK